MPGSYRKTLLKKFSHFWNNYPRVRIVTKTFLGIIGLFFIDSMRILYLMSAVVADPMNPAKPDDLRIKLYAAQRYPIEKQRNICYALVNNNAQVIIFAHI